MLVLPRDYFIIDTLLDTRDPDMDGEDVIEFHWGLQLIVTTSSYSTFCLSGVEDLRDGFASASL